MVVLKLEIPTQLAHLKSLIALDQSILDALPMGIYACDAAGCIIRVNQRAVALWGCSPRLQDSSQRFCGCFKVESLEGEYISPENSPMARSVLHGEAFEGVEAWVQNPDGKRWVARVNVAPLRNSDGELVGAINCFQDVTSEYETRVALVRHQRTFDLAMVASKMGTWRYTFADNICVYDKNAQELYGLTEGNFLHDQDGVNSKFHPNDIGGMWEGVAKAVHKDGDGQYDVVYRVKQIDGSWRWLSAWGLVEFEGQGSDRKPVAIAGASRDLSEMKLAEDHQLLLVNELNHRVKNTLATVQSLVAQTLRGTSDFETARKSINARILSLAMAHDLLTSRNWSGAGVDEVVKRAIAPFPSNQFVLEGSSTVISPKQALALSLALNELATNAVKYGALSRHEGWVEVRWTVQNDQLELNWHERGGPVVIPPSRRGFGSRLLESGLSHDLGGRTEMDFASDGVRCSIRASVASFQ